METITRRKRWMPPAHARVNWSHPLARGLSDLWLPHGPAGRNYARSAQPTATGTVTRSSTKWGEARSFSAGSYITIPSNGEAAYSHNGSALTGWAVKMLFRPLSWATSDSSLFSKGINGLDCDLDFVVDGSTGGDLTGGRVAKGETGSGANTDWSVGRHCDVVLTSTATSGTDNYTVHSDGVQVGAALNPGGTNGNPTDADLHIGHAALGDRTINDSGMELSYFAVWRRNLSANEIADLYEDPFQLLVW